MFDLTWLVLVEWARYSPLPIGTFSWAIAHRGTRKAPLWMITWVAMLGSRDRPREGARGAQGTYRGDPEEGFRGDRPEGGVQRKVTGDRNCKSDPPFLTAAVT